MADSALERRPSSRAPPASRAPGQMQQSVSASREGEGTKAGRLGWATYPEPRAQGQTGEGQQV